MGIKDKFIKKIYAELQQYKKLYGDKESKENSKLEICSCIYEILISSADEFSDMLLMNLVNQSTNILESIYKDCAQNEDYYMVVREHMKNTEYDIAQEEDEECTWWSSVNYDDGGIGCDD